MSQITLDQAIHIALQHHQAGRLAEAEGIYRRVLELQPDHPQALHLLGAIAGEHGDYPRAAELIERAVALSPQESSFHKNLARVRNAMNRPDDALASARRALELSPDYADAHFQQGIALLTLRQYAQAAAEFHAVLRLDPQHVDAHNSLGNALHGMGDTGEALACYRAALSLSPDYPPALNNLGNIHREVGQFPEAIDAYRRALRKQPESAEVLNNLGIALAGVGRLQDALAAIEQSVRLRPSFAEGHFNCGNMLKELGRLDEALAAFRRAMELRPTYVEAHSNLVYTQLFHPEIGADAQRAELALWNERHAQPLRSLIEPWTNSRDPERRLRVGYVSPDFRSHVIGRNLLPLFRHHNRERFEIFCYSNVARPDAITDEFRRRCNTWRSIVGLADPEVAELIRRDQIDILVDLSLHLDGNRLLVFARKPAPVQVTFAGYPGSTGVEAIDFRLTDPSLDPPRPVAEDDALYCEQSLRLPDTFWCHDSLAAAPEVSDLPARRLGYITFGCLNNFTKLNDAAFGLWAKVMRMVPTSRLILLAPEGPCRPRVLHFFENADISPTRIEFVSYAPRADYLRTYSRIDIGLDSFPYNGHSTSLDSLWMGVPVITLAGKTVVGRAGLSQLTNLKFTELIAHTRAEFVQIAATLAGDLPRLTSLRAGLRQRMLDSPLTDAPRFAGGIEAAYRQMWARWCSAPSAS